MTTRPFGAADAFGALATTESLTDAQIEERAQALLDQLTLDEKIGLMDGDPPFWSGLADMFTGGYNKHPWVAGAVPRLGIPGVRFSDGPRGIVMPGATTFPVAMARGASWDPALEERIGDAIGRELRALVAKANPRIGRGASGVNRKNWRDCCLSGCGRLRVPE